MGYMNLQVALDTVDINIICMWVCAHRGWKVALNALELELPEVVSYPCESWGLNCLWGSIRTAHTLKPLSHLSSPHTLATLILSI